MRKSPPDLVRLRALADAATPGPWKYEPHTTAGRVWVRMGNMGWVDPNLPDSHNAHKRVFHDGTNAYERAEKDAKFIAACDPDTVKWLVRVAQAAGDLFGNDAPTGYNREFMARMVCLRDALADGAGK